MLEPKHLSVSCFSDFIRIIRFSAVASFATFLGVTALAQEVTRVYPRYAVTGVPTTFTVEGKFLAPSRNSPHGVEHRFETPGVCAASKPTQPATKTRYHFVCTPKTKAGTVQLHLTYKPKRKPPVSLWSEYIQILSAAPRVDSVVIIGDTGTGQTLVHCKPASNCAITVGSVTQGRPLSLAIAGANLPATLQLSFIGCKASSNRPDLSNTTLRDFTCTPSTVGEKSLRVLSAALVNGGAELLQTTVTIDSPTPTPPFEPKSTVE